MTTYYIEQNNKIVLHDTERERLIRTLKYLPQYKSLSIQETERPIDNCEWADTQEYIDKKHIQEVKNEVNKLEYQTGLTRPMREIIISGQISTSEYIVKKIQEIETLAEELRK